MSGNVDRKNFMIRRIFDELLYIYIYECKNVGLILIDLENCQ